MRRDRPTSAHRPGVEVLEGRTLLSVTFDRLVFSTTKADTAATITLNRFDPATGGTQGTEAVQLVSVPVGTAVAGLDYPTFAQTVLFQSGETTKDVTVPIVQASADRGTRSVRLTLRPVTPNSIVGAAPVATLSIAHGDDVTPPRIESSYAVARNGRVTAFVLKFSEDMDRAIVENVNNYAVEDPYSYRRSSSGNFLKALLIPLRSAVYDAAARTVTLTPKRPARSFHAFIIMNRESFNASQKGTVPVASPMADRTGNLIDGTGNGQPTGMFAVEALTRTVAPRRS